MWSFGTFGIVEENLDFQIVGPISTWERGNIGKQTILLCRIGEPDDPGAFHRYPRQISMAGSPRPDTQTFDFDALDDLGSFELAPPC